MDITKDLLQQVVELCKDNGANTVIVKTTQNNEHQIRFSNSQIDISKQWKENGMDIFTARGRHVKFISIQDPDESKIKQQIPTALKHLKSEPKSLLFWGIEKKKQHYMDKLDFIDEQIDAISEEGPRYVNSAIQSSSEMGSTKVSGVLYSGKKRTGLLTSNGNGGIYTSSYYRMTIRSFFDAESSGQDVIAGRSLENLENKIIQSAQRSAEIAKKSVGGVQGKSGTYDIIFSPTVAGNVLGSIINGANPISILLGMSPIGKKLGKKIGPENLTVYDDPTHPEGLESFPFDMEGVTANPTSIIKDGVFVNLLQNTSSAKIWSLLGLIGMGKRRSKTTGNCGLGYLLEEGSGPRSLFPGSSNRVFKPGDSSLDEMIEDSQKPTILLTSNWYTRFTNMKEGSFSTIPRDGSFLIENGEIVRSIRKFRLSDNILRICENISHIGKDTPQIQWWEVEAPTFVPYLKIKDCTITTATD